MNVFAFRINLYFVFIVYLHYSIITKSIIDCLIRRKLEGRGENYV